MVSGWIAFTSRLLSEGNPCSSAVSSAIESQICRMRSPCAELRQPLLRCGVPRNLDGIDTVADQQLRSEILGSRRSFFNSARQRGGIDARIGLNQFPKLIGRLRHACHYTIANSCCSRQHRLQMLPRQFRHTGGGGFVGV